jgi:hypothetical protein
MPISASARAAKVKTMSSSYSFPLCGSITEFFEHLTIYHNTHSRTPLNLNDIRYHPISFGIAIYRSILNKGGSLQFEGDVSPHPLQWSIIHSLILN